MISGELAYWHDVALNLLTDSQLDTTMPHSGHTPRSVLSRVRRDHQVDKDFIRCPYCAFSTYSVEDYCSIHKPIVLKHNV